MKNTKVTNKVNNKASEIYTIIFNEYKKLAVKEHEMRKLMKEKNFELNIVSQWSTAKLMADKMWQMVEKVGDIL